jgi:hypothetical protein
MQCIKISPATAKLDLCSISSFSLCALLISLSYYALVQVGGPGTLQFLNITSLTPGAPYAFELLTRSVSGSLALPGSASVPALPALATPLQCPAALRVAAVEASSITVAWDLPAPGRPAHAYPVRLRLIAVRLGGGATAESVELDPAATRHVFEGLETGVRCGLRTG